MLSPFQRQRMLDIERSGAYLHWCANPREFRHNKHQGPKQYTWYTRDSRLHTERVGRTRILSHICHSPICPDKKATATRRR